jgi:uncharacterized protein YaaQ
MKVVLAITTSEGADDIVDALKEKNYRVTVMSSMGGFLRRRNATLMIGVRDEQVDEVLGAIREHAPAPVPAGRRGKVAEPQSSVTLFVLDMARFEHYQP